MKGVIKRRIHVEIRFGSEILQWDGYKRFEADFWLGKMLRTIPPEIQQLSGGVLLRYYETDYRINS